MTYFSYPNYRESSKFQRAAKTDLQSSCKMRHRQAAVTNQELASVSNIRPFSTSDKTALVTLFEEMQSYYGVACPPPGVIESNLAELPAGVEIIVAETDRIVGFASFSAIYPGPGLKSGLFMKELFVTAESRGSGVGKALIQAVARVAVERGHTRVDWMANRNNPGLLSYYSGLGALAQHEKIFYRLAGDTLTSLAASTNS
jgi:GNAT superfamily N-acetyltransferase